LKGTTDSGGKYESKKESDWMRKMMNYAILFEIIFQEEKWHTGEKV